MKNTLYICLILAILASCKKDFVVADINNKTLKVNSPANNLVTSSNVVLFWWDELDGAEKYNVQVVKPDFANLIQLIADTNVADTKLNLSLSPGNYQWRIRAFNAGHKTAYQTYSFKVDSSNVLTSQLVNPTSPLNGYTTKNKTVDFTWQILVAASSYSIELKMNNTVINTTTTVNNNYQYTFPITSAGNYTCTWRIKALNASSISQYNAAQTFTIDNIAPPVSTPSLPVSNSVVKDTVELLWKRPIGSDAASDSLFIYSDSGFLNLAARTAVTVTKIKINAIDASNPLPAGNGSVNAIQYWWRLKSVDSLGNASGYSSSLSFQLFQ